MLGGCLVGRDAECARVAELLEGPRSQQSGALVLVGAPGIGKSALCGWAIARADGMRVLRVRGVESEVDLRFAGLWRDGPELPLAHERAPSATGACSLLDQRTARATGMYHAALTALLLKGRMAPVGRRTPATCILCNTRFQSPQHRRAPACQPLATVRDRRLRCVVLAGDANTARNPSSALCSDAASRIACRAYSEHRTTRTLISIVRSAGVGEAMTQQS